VMNESAVHAILESSSVPSLNCKLLRDAEKGRLDGITRFRVGVFNNGFHPAPCLRCGMKSFPSFLAKFPTDDPGNAQLGNFDHGRIVLDTVQCSLPVLNWRSGWREIS